jgi:hypothetical protein
LNPTDGLILERDEEFQDFSKKYRLFSDGQIGIAHWDSEDQIWQNDDRFCNTKAKE